MSKYNVLLTATLFFLITSCNTNKSSQQELIEDEVQDEISIPISKKVEEFVKVSLAADLSKLTANQKKMIPILIEAADLTDEIFWDQAFGSKQSLLKDISGEDTLQFVLINYGPWDRLGGNKPFIERYGRKPLGANLYPKDIKYLEFINMKYDDKYSAYTILRRDDNDELYTIPYHKAYWDKLQKISLLLIKAAKYADNDEFKKYLESRAEALLFDDFYKSDAIWLDMKTNPLDFVIGPFEDKEDNFLETKTAYESYLLLKNYEWTEKLERFKNFIPQLKKQLPIETSYIEYVKELPLDIRVYDVLYCSGIANSGSKGITRSRPLDGRIVKEKGDRKLVFKNVMQHKFDKILVPICNDLLDKEQRNHLKFEAFMYNSLFFVISDVVTIQQTINNKGSVKSALKDYYIVISQLASDLQRLYFITKLNEAGHLNDVDLMDNYVCYIGDIYRSVRFGIAHIQGQESMIRFNYFMETGALTRDDATGTYKINFEKMKKSLSDLLALSIRIMGDGDYQAAKQLIEEKGIIGKQLKADLNRLKQANIPKDLRYEQGVKLLGL